MRNGQLINHITNTRSTYIANCSIVRRSHLTIMLLHLQFMQLADYNLVYLLLTTNEVFSFNKDFIMAAIHQTLIQIPCKKTILFMTDNGDKASGASNDLYHCWKPANCPFATTRACSAKNCGAVAIFNSILRNKAAVAFFVARSMFCC